MPAPAAPFRITLAEAAELLAAGRIVAFPTETVYGLGAVASNTDAVLSVYEAKGRPRFNPLIVHCASVQMAEALAAFPPLARTLADRFWPGPLSLVLPTRQRAPISDLVTAGLDTVAIRLPAHPLARELIAAVGEPLAAPSANPSGRLSPTTAAQVDALFQGAVPVLDGGPCEAGLESTIVAVDGGTPTLLRAGAISRRDIEAVAGRPLGAAPPGSIAAPGMLASHYAPRARLRLDAKGPARSEAWLGFGPDPSGLPTHHRNLSPSGDLREAARNLFAMLHELDATGAGGIAVAPVPDDGLGEAINDRLRRAAAPR